MKLSLILAAAIGAAFALLHSDNLTPNESLLPGTAPTQDINTPSKELGTPQYIDAATAIKKQALYNGCTGKGGTITFDDSTRTAVCTWGYNREEYKY